MTSIHGLNAAIYFFHLSFLETHFITIQKNHLKKETLN